MYRPVFILTGYFLRHPTFVVKVLVDFTVQRFQAVRRNVTDALISLGKMNLVVVKPVGLYLSLCNKLIIKG